MLLQRADEQQQFLSEVPSETLVEDVVRSVARINNLRHRIHRLKLQGEQLSKYGPAKEPSCQGIDEYQAEPVNMGEHYLQDPTGQRTGDGEVDCISKVYIHVLLVTKATNVDLRTLRSRASSSSTDTDEDPRGCRAANAQGGTAIMVLVAPDLMLRAWHASRGLL